MPATNRVERSDYNMHRKHIIKNQHVFVACSILLINCFTPSSTSVNPTGSMALAFPGAEGYGANTVGGRGGEVIEVTNLNDSGPGSLRAAIEATGPRIVVFRVGGTIELLTHIRIKNPYITIVGQTAPGDGITLKNDPSNPDSPLVVETGEVIIRYVRFRPGASTELSDNLRALTIGGDGKNIIIDHCSFSWATDENLTVWDNASDISIQWSIVSEGLYNSTSSSGTQSQAVYFGSQSTRISLHHNLLAHNNRRNPRVMGGDIDIVNNVIYNTEGSPARLWSDSFEHHINGGRYNYVGNYIKRGSNSLWDYEVKLRSRDDNITIPATFISSNIGPNRPDESVPDEAIVHPDGREFMIDTRHDFPLVTTTSAFEAYDQVLAGAGVTLPGRDVVDERIIDEVITGTGQIIDDPSEVGGWPILAAGVPPSDSDHDGMPDQWEKLYGFNPNDATDGPADADADGYTNVEEYLNGTHPRIISADIALAKESDSDTVVVGNEFSYILNVYNNGPDIATNVTLTDTLAENLSFVSVTTSQGNCSGKNIASAGHCCRLEIL